MDTEDVLVDEGSDDEPAIKRTQLDWGANQGRNRLILALIVSRIKAHKKTKGTRMEAKWQQVCEEFNAETNAGITKTKTLNAAFWRAVGQVKRKYALDVEGADASAGLPADAPELDRLLIDLANDADNAEVFSFLPCKFMPLYYYIYM
jgi:hypothetical protein